MSEFKGTPGPWEDEGPNVDGERCIFGSNDYGVCVTIPAGNPDMRPDVSVANARLIAAAPALLEAAQFALSIAESWIHDQLDGTSQLEVALRELSPVRDAIARALGE